MKRFFILAFALVCQLPFTALQAAAGEDSLQFRVYATMHQNYWKPSDDDDGDPQMEDPFDYVTDSIYIWGSRLQVLSQGDELFHLGKQGSLKPSDHQDELIRNNESSQRTLDSLQLGISPLILFKDMGAMKTLRLDYQRDYFTGSATTEIDNVLFLSQNGGQYHFVRGDSVTIESDFKEWDLTVKTHSGGRIGVYKTETLKPRSTSYYTASNETVVADIEIRGMGAIFLSETASTSFDLKLGQARFHARQSMVDSAAFDGSGLDFAIRWHWHPNLLSSVKGMTLSPLIGGQFRMQFSSGGDESKATPLNHDGSSGDVNMEFLFDLGVMMGYQW